MINGWTIITLFLALCFIATLYFGSEKSKENCLREVEKRYEREARVDARRPFLTFFPEGAFFTYRDGTVTVWDYDRHGNLFPITPEQQDLRKRLLYQRIGVWNEAN